jgi:hypothetical protein
LIVIAGQLAATSSMSVGSSSPPPVMLTRPDTGHMRRRSSPAGRRSSVPAAPSSMALECVAKHRLRPCLPPKKDLPVRGMYSRKWRRSS